MQDQTVTTPPGENEPAAAGVLGYAVADTWSRVRWEVWEGGGRIDVPPKARWQASVARAFLLGLTLTTAGPLLFGGVALAALPIVSLPGVSVLRFLIGGVMVAVGGGVALLVAGAAGRWEKATQTGSSLLVRAGRIRVDGPWAGPKGVWEGEVSDWTRLATGPAWVSLVAWGLGDLHLRTPADPRIAVAKWEDQAQLRRASAALHAAMGLPERDPFEGMDDPAIRSLGRRIGE